ncbi:hypothetical protein N7494_006992 [Penicillium frequentans]|uniref:Uncharacterized protein n=1 Tax=Penicillium frequentans TaxID=3151616 RepID=A0AAD6CRS4_9EURO|nr:hypothetical protein N7494_006992 [Penicillium glabrum]
MHEFLTKRPMVQATTFEAAYDRSTDRTALAPSLLQRCQVMMQITTFGIQKLKKSGSGKGIRAKIAAIAFRIKIGAYLEKIH